MSDDGFYAYDVKKYYMRKIRAQITNGGNTYGDRIEAGNHTRRTEEDY